MKKPISVLLAVVMIAAAFATIPASAAQIFDDVEEGRWSAEAIEYAYENGYMLGTGDGSFSPDAPVTRAAVATVLWRRQGCPEPSGPSGFSDVDPGEWYADAVAWAKEAGVVYGVTDTEFDPERAVTREALAAMLCRFSAFSLVSVPERADLSAFEDGDAVSAWADDAVR